MPEGTQVPPPPSPPPGSWGWWAAFLRDLSPAQAVLGVITALALAGLWHIVKVGGEAFPIWLRDAWAPLLIVGAAVAGSLFLVVRWVAGIVEARAVEADERFKRMERAQEECLKREKRHIRRARRQDMQIAALHQALRQARIDIPQESAFDDEDDE